VIYVLGTNRKARTNSWAQHTQNHSRTATDTDRTATHTSFSRTHSLGSMSALVPGVVILL
jgi:hypothetical protein